MVLDKLKNVLHLTQTGFVKNNSIKFTYSGYPDYGGTVLSNMYYRFFDRILVKT